MPSYTNVFVSGKIQDFDQFMADLESAKRKVSVPLEVPTTVYIDSGILNFLEIGFITQGQFNQIVQELKDKYPYAIMV